ncbi:MAG TPA: outer membrane lipoprotein carrier protein LolA [Candidatus Deferrimicrobium sp.]|nr:outer membrane lipoprotein carrier protein LolA [Candidatus Deferrimicrobium sp.]
MLRMVCIVWWLFAGAVAPTDSFDKIKRELSQAACARFEFVSVIESEVFETADSAFGRAYIARDGRFLVTLGSDIYLNDGRCLYSYSAENNQVIMETKADSAEPIREISFLTRLDAIYTTFPVRSGETYRLLKKPGQDSQTPDSLTVFIDRRTRRLERLEYFDINDERTIIHIRSQQSDDSCDDKRFTPDFPESAERIRL